MPFSVYSELYHGRRWHEDSRFKVYMAEVNGYHVYVGDVVEFIHPEHGVHMAKILHFYEGVGSCM